MQLLVQLCKLLYLCCVYFIFYEYLYILIILLRYFGKTVSNSLHAVQGLNNALLIELCTFAEWHVEVKKRSGVLMSIRYPEDYYDDMLATYTFHSAWTTTHVYCGVDLDFKDFSLQASVGCRADALAINNETYCGHQLKQSSCSCLLARNRVHLSINPHLNVLIIHMYCTCSEIAIACYINYDD